MRVRVDFEKMESLAKNINEDAEGLEKEINSLMNSLERMKFAWEGPDADIFYSKAHEYINRMYVLSEFMKTTSGTISYNSMQYQDQDMAFSNDLKKETGDNECNGNKF